MNIHPIKKIVLLASLVAWTFPSLAEESLREMCRKDVAGMLLNHFDSWNLSQEKLLLLSTSQKRSREQLIKADAELKEREKEIAKNKGNFDIKKVEAKDIAQAKFDTIQQKLKEIQSSMEESQKNLAESKKQYEDFKKASEKIFVIQEKKGTEKSNLLLEVKYKSQCPKYRAQCPLKNNERKILKENILPHLDHKTFCERYSNIQ